jgi:hypothetical protein
MDSAVTASETLVMAGRTFRLALPLSMGQRVYWDVVLRRAGVRTAPQTVEAWDAVVGQLEATDQLQYLVACCLVEEGPMDRGRVAPRTPTRTRRSSGA